MTEAWEACFAHDPACEEAAAGLVRAYGSEGLRQLATEAYERCRARPTNSACGRPRPWNSCGRPPSSRTLAGHSGASVGAREERRVVTVMFAEVLAASAAANDDPEDLRELVGEATANVITAVEALGGTVTAVSGAGLQAVFGAPEAHEDDPERGVPSSLPRPFPEPMPRPLVPRESG